MVEFRQRGRMHKNSGQSLIEFALILPMLALLIFGAMDIGRIITTKIVMTNAAREGANYLSRRANVEFEGEGDLTEEQRLLKREDEARDVIVAYCANQRIEIDKDSEDIKIQGCCNPGAAVLITVSKSVDLFYGNLLQFFGFLNDGTIQVASEVQMKVK